jgi:hypothetical protein
VTIPAGFHYKAAVAPNKLRTLNRRFQCVCGNLDISNAQATREIGLGKHVLDKMNHEMPVSLDSYEKLKSWVDAKEPLLPPGIVDRCSHSILEMAAAS